MILPKIEEQPVFVYFWLLEDDYELDEHRVKLDPIVKIGITRDWTKRRTQLLRQLNKGVWGDWLESGFAQDRLLGIIEGSFAMEKYLHTKFKNFALGNELFWYQPIENEIDLILDENCNCTLHQVWETYG